LKEEFYPKKWLALYFVIKKILQKF